MNKKSFLSLKTNHLRDSKLINNQSLAREVLSRHTNKYGHLRIQKALIQKKIANGFTGWQWGTVRESRILAG
jgi:hypothetical protein